MEDLELLKQDWKRNSEDFEKISEKAIYKMMKSKTLSLSHFIFGIGIMEIFLWMLFNYFYEFNYPFARYVIFVIFVGLMIFSYYKIKTESNVKMLMKSILRLRNCVILYVVLTIGIIVFDIVIDFDSHVHHLLAGWMSGEEGIRHSVDPEDVSPGVMSYMMFTLLCLILFAILGFVYRKTYGKLLKKLKANYHELTKLEESNA